MREVGVYSPNDICGFEDLPDVPGGDSRYANWNYGPLSKWEELSISLDAVEQAGAGTENREE